MNNQKIIIKYLNTLKRNKQLTSFISYIFDYKNLNESNYIFRMKKENNNIIIDIYDNISKNKLNKYIFNYENSTQAIKKSRVNDIYVTNIYMKNLKNSRTKIYKLAYLFTLNKKDMENYAKTFLKQEFIELLLKAIK